MKSFDYYTKPKTSYPSKKDYTTRYIYNNGKVVWHGPLKEYDLVVNEYLHESSVKQDVVDNEAYIAHKNEYNKEYARLNGEFQNDLFEHFNVANHPKRFKVYELAYEWGHSSGFSEIYNYFSDIVELIQD